MHKPRHTGHVGGASIAIAMLSVALAAGLELLGVIGRVDAAIVASVSLGDAETHPAPLPEWLPWLAAAALSLGLSAAVLSSPGLWRRVILCLVLVFLISAWVPVLSLANMIPQITAPWVATVWAGICSIFYAASHRMPCDIIADSPP